ncbi:MAG: hypothetical protein LBE31_07640 [Deltaproteobacteria bacterium]|jgi:hypothetical protein|nr:hypothetical protein [Deltaproteobacteria bacterium]
MTEKNAPEIWGLITDIELPLEINPSIALPFESSSLKMITLDLLREASTIAKPKAAWKLALIDWPYGPEADAIKVGEVVFQSSFISGNLRDLGRAFPFVATEGQELAAWAAKLPLKIKSAAFLVRYLALKEAERRLEEFLTAHFDLGTIGAMSPGVLPEWPLSGQVQLFELLGPLVKALEVTLKSPSMWMNPDVSSSGLFFETEAGYHNCLLCPLDCCPIRRFERQG